MSDIRKQLLEIPPAVVHQLERNRKLLRILDASVEESSLMFKDIENIVTKRENGFVVISRKRGLQERRQLRQMDPLDILHKHSSLLLDFKRKYKHFLSSIYRITRDIPADNACKDTSSSSHSHKQPGKKDSHQSDIIGSHLSTTIEESDGDLDPNIEVRDDDLEYGQRMPFGSSEESD